MFTDGFLNCYLPRVYHECFRVLTVTYQVLLTRVSIWLKFTCHKIKTSTTKILKQSTRHRTHLYIYHPNLRHWALMGYCLPSCLSNSLARPGICHEALSLATLTLGSSKINQHYWRFHGSGVIAAPQIIGLISFCTGMHHEYFFRSSMCFRVPHLCSKIPKINNWSMDSGVHSVCFPGDFAIKTVVGFLR